MRFVSTTVALAFGSHLVACVAGAPPHVAKAASTNTGEYQGVFVTSRVPMYFVTTSTGVPWVNAPTAEQPWLAEIRGDKLVDHSARYAPLVDPYPNPESSAQIPADQYAADYRHYEVLRALLRPGAADEVAFTHDLRARGGTLSMRRISGTNWLAPESFVAGSFDVERVIARGPTGGALFALREYACHGSFSRSTKCENFTGLRFYNEREERVEPALEVELACGIETTDGPGVLTYDSRAGVSLWTKQGFVRALPPQSKVTRAYHSLICEGKSARLVGTQSTPVPGERTEIVTGVFAPAWHSEEMSLLVYGFDERPPSLKLEEAPRPLPRATPPPANPKLKCKIEEEAHDGDVHWAIEDCRATGDDQSLVESRLIATLPSRSPPISLTGPRVSTYGHRGL